jgi:O-antigen/teichoic acid export membrane protein
MLGSSIAKMVGEPRLLRLLWWLPLSIFMFGCYQALNYWFTRNDRFREVSISQVARASSAAVFQLLSGLLFPSGAGLVGGQVFGQTSASLSLLWQSWCRDREVLFSGFDKVRMKSVARRFVSFPARSAPQALVNSVSQSLPVFLLGVLFNPLVAGLYVMAQRVVQAPAQLVGSSFRQSLLPQYARAVSRAHVLTPGFIRTTSFLILLGLPGVAALVIWGPDLFAWGFGERWYEAGVYARWLVLGLWFDVAIPPATNVLTVLQRQGLQLVFEIVVIVLRASAIAVGAWMHDPLIAVAGFSLAGAASSCVLIIVSYHLTRQHDRGLVSA